MRPTTPSGSRTEKLTTSGPIGIEAPFISVTKPAKNSICAAAIMASLTISLDRIAAVGGIDHREFIGILAQDFRDPPQNLGALERQHAPPFLECGFRGRHRGVDIVGAASATLPSDWPVPGLIVST